MSTNWCSSTACRQTCVYGFFHVILESGGDHNYRRHTKGREAKSWSKELGNLHEQIVSRQFVKAAEQKLAVLEVKISRMQTRCHQGVSRHQILTKSEAGLL